MDHFHRNVSGGFAGDKNDATPVGRFHLRQVMPRQAHAAHKICFDNRVPVIVGDLLEWLRLVNTEVVDKNIDRGHTLDAF